LADVEYREFDIAALNALRNADWPGDLAQLDAVIRNLIQTSLGEKITLEDVKRVLTQFENPKALPEETSSEAISADNATTHHAESTQNKGEPATANTAEDQAWHPNFNQPLREARDEFERTYIQYHMKKVSNNMSKLAEIAGLERTHLYRKLKQLNIKIKN